MSRAFVRESDGDEAGDGQPELPISPRIIRVKTSQQTDVGRVIHANSITLTPGTVSLAFEDGDIIVHAISRAAAEGTLEGSIDRRVTKVEQS